MSTGITLAVAMSLDLVGRETELAELRGSIEGAASGASALLLDGEAAENSNA